MEDPNTGPALTPSRSAARVVTFTRCVPMEIAGHGRKVRGTIKLWLRGAFDEAAASLEMWVDEKEGPKLQLRPLPDGFVETRDLIAHGMEVVSVIEAATATEFFFDDPVLQKQMIEQAAGAVAQSDFEQAVSKLDIGGVSPKAHLLTGATTAIGKLQ